MLFLFIGNQLLIAQTDSLEVHEINGKSYYIHVVKKGESLYAIHKKYNVPLDVIKKENPGVLDGLSVDEKVFIPVKRSEENSTSTNGNFIEHTVEKKQTLYGIAKLYNVEQYEIMAVNPELNALPSSVGLKEGQIIKIPVKKLKEVKSEKRPTKDTLKRKTHVVQKGETLYALGKKYGIPVDSIKQANNGLEQGLREGETIYIPLPKEKQIELAGHIEKVDSSLKVDSFKLKPIYHIGLFLPFYLDENDEMVENRSALEEKRIYPRSKFAIEFYNGFIHMLDSLASNSSTFKVFAYDTQGDDTSRVMQLLKRSEMESFDLIIGPLYYENFKLVSAFADEHNIPLVTPVKQSNKILLGHSNIYKVIPSKTSIIAPLTELLVDSFSTANLLAIDHSESKESALVDMFISSYNKRLNLRNDSLTNPPIQKLTVSNNNQEIISKLKRDRNNVLFVPSSNASYVTTLFSQLIGVLNDRNYKDCQITLFGLEDWSKFKNIDVDYYQRLNVHYVSSQFIHEQDSTTNHCIQNFVKKTSTYPSNNAMLGCDLAEYFGLKLLRTGSAMTPDDEPFQGKSISLSFFKTGIESGYENTAGTIVRYYDYSIQPILR